MISYHTCPLATLGGKDSGGMNVYVHELTRQLGKMGIYVDVFTRSQDEHVPHVLHDLGYGNRVVHIPAGPEVPLSKSELVQHIPEFVDHILDFANKKGCKYDLIHSHYWMSGIAAIALKKEWNVPIIQMFHTLGRMKNRIARSPEEREGDYRLNGEQEVLDNVDAVVIATPAEKTQLEFLYQAEHVPTFIIPPGVDTSRFYPIPKDEAREYVGLEPDDHMILFVGRIEPLKGIDTLLQAILKLQTKGIIQCCNQYLVIIGGNSEVEAARANTEMARLQKMCVEIGIGDLVLFVGNRSQDALPYYYSAADAVVMPSHYESFGMVALEAMACGTPVVASQVGGLAFLVKDEQTGYVVPNNDPEALAEKLSDLLENPALREKLGKQAAEYARGYDWEIIAARIAGLYNQVIDQKVQWQSVHGSLH
ncbi:MAG: glycosyltransferase [Chloroflexi bacterium]|nr:glycosyltransferase [Chloroflexota bacterium]